MADVAMGSAALPDVGPEALEQSAVFGTAAASGGATVPDTSVVTNRVWDVQAGPGFVRWETADPDPTGTSYPGPGTFGVDTDDYCIEYTE